MVAEPRMLLGRTGAAKAVALLAVLAGPAILLGSCAPPQLESTLAPDEQGPWDPPDLQDPETVALDSGNSHARLSRDRDYLVELAEPISKVGGIVISGGRNVVLIGGHITIPKAPEDAEEVDRRALLIRWQSGTVHIEGLLIDNSGGDLSEGIQINAPKARIQLVNVRVEGLDVRDAQDLEQTHPDVVQPWGGVGELRISGLTGSSAYQGIYLHADHHQIGRVTLDRVNLIGLPGSRYLLWAAPGVSVELGEVWVQPAQDRSYRRTLRPEPPDPTWAAVRQGRPPGGDFVPAGAVGVGYEREAVPKR